MADNDKEITALEVQQAITDITSAIQVWKNDATPRKIISLAKFAKKMSNKGVSTAIHIKDLKKNIRALELVITRSKTTGRDTSPLEAEIKGMKEDLAVVESHYTPIKRNVNTGKIIRKKKRHNKQTKLQSKLQVSE